MEQKNSSLINEDLLWGINLEVNGKVYNSNDILKITEINKEKKINKNCKNFDEILENISIIKNASDKFLQNILDTNPQLQKNKEIKEIEEPEELS